LKVLAGLLTYRTTVAQDGAIQGPEEDGAEIRVSVMPTNHGERVALRMLGRHSAPRRIETLNLPDSTVSLLKQMLAAPTGLLVLTGPTGSGKTTTIYAMIRELLRQQQDPASIITIEDPIECELPGISQTAVSEARQWGYAHALRAAMRQDVKTIVVGEMRDREVVKVTLDAALSGHRVITTYHAGDIPSVYARLLHQGFEPFLIAAAVTGVVTQRLVPAINGQGRLPVMAALIPNDEWRDFVASNPGLTQLRRQVRQYPEADLSQVAEAMMQHGAISRIEALKIGGEDGDSL
jgi:type II secretory ATPase GspE/PulE/Tfp pilus assembly ATPase PilB-like protein